MNHSQRAAGALDLQAGDVPQDVALLAGRLFLLGAFLCSVGAWLFAQHGLGLHELNLQLVQLVPKLHV